MQQFLLLYLPLQEVGKHLDKIIREKNVYLGPIFKFTNDDVQQRSFGMFAKIFV